ncbi:hypothetical protein MSUIS_01200 [Mycoplasma suis KI3806]|uniref:Uncharacterized protein n=1 Tax=Mycoplasma suis (strain KI_3806) TaxID=708248 RepID=F0V2Z1_MYCS3|nr:hypothetical protein [Mycoplasma suis]CBZ40213.1 hypothetical protein MSUIS_01200 [Mycoplasma suis KI3806]
MSLAAAKLVGYLSAIAVGTTSTASAGSYGLFSYFKKDSKNNSNSSKTQDEQLTHSTPSSSNPEGSLNSLSPQTQSTSVSAEARNSGQTPSQREEVLGQSGIEVNNRSTRSTSEDSRDTLSHSSVVDSSTRRETIPKLLEQNSPEDGEWKFYIGKNSSEITPEDDEAEDGDFFLAEYIKRESGQEVTCQRLLKGNSSWRQMKGEGQCKVLSSWSWWSEKEKERDEKLSHLLFVDKEIVKKTLEKFGLYGENLASSKKTTWAKDSLVCSKQSGSLGGDDDSNKFLITCQ